jgi:hypothetical protein
MGTTTTISISQENIYDLIRTISAIVHSHRIQVHKFSNCHRLLGAAVKTQPCVPASWRSGIQTPALSW